MKSLLAISWEMPPLSGPRAVQVPRTLVALAAAGWRSRVVCFDAHSDRYQQDHRVSLEAQSGGRALRLPVPSPEEWLPFRALWRVCPPLKQLPDEKRVWVPSALAEARRALHDEAADVLVSFAQPWSDHLIGLALRRETGLPWVAHFSDPWTDSPYQQGGPWVRRRLAAMERDVIAEATRLVFVNSYTCDRVMAKYPETWRTRCHVIPQGSEPGLLPAPRERVHPGPLRIVYTGRFYAGVRTPDTFLEALASVARAKPLAGRVDVEFVGAGMEQYERRATELGLAAIVRFTGRLSPQHARERAATADVLMTIDAPSAGPGLFLPSKLIDYLPLDRPILGLTPLEGPSADLIRELGYAPVDPADGPGIGAAIDGLLAAHEDGGLAVAAQHRKIARRYTITETTRAFAAVLDAAVGAA